LIKRKAWQDYHAYKNNHAGSSLTRCLDQVDLRRGWRARLFGDRRIASQTYRLWAARHRRFWSKVTTPHKLRVSWYCVTMSGH